MQTQKDLPHEVVTEFIGQASFSPNQERDLEIAEQIASSTYSSLEQLTSICKGASSPANKFQKGWDKALKQANKPDSWFQTQIANEQK